VEPVHIDIAGVALVVEAENPDAVATVVAPGEVPFAAGEELKVTRTNAIRLARNSAPVRAL